MLLTEGKTKKIWSTKGNHLMIISEYKNAITAFDDPDYTKEFDLKAQYSNTTTCNVFRFLKNQNIPISYLRKYDDISFLAYFTQMIPLEVVVRRYAVGSYLKRNPTFVTPEGKPPHHFAEPVIEFFLKTSKGKLISPIGQVLVDGLDPKKGEEDPLILEPLSTVWELFHPKKPIHEPGAQLGKHVMANKVLLLDKDAKILIMSRIALRAFFLLEAALADIGDYKLIDYKVEFGINPYGVVVISDVIDNDSWRLKNNKWEELSKEAYRQGENLSDVEIKYGFVADLSKKIANF